MTYKVVLTDSAVRDLESIGRWIATDDPLAAATFLRRLYRRAMTLEDFPNRGAMWRGPYRFLSERSYLIIYRVDEERQVVNVVGFVHGARQHFPEIED